MEIKGNLIVNTTAEFIFAPTTTQAHSTILFNGAQGQSIQGKGKLIIGTHATVEVANPNCIELQRALNIKGELKFSNKGFLKLNTFNLIVDSMITHANAEQHIITNALYSDTSGYLIRNFYKGDSSYLFPISVNSNEYNPCTISSVSKNNTQMAVKMFITSFKYRLTLTA